LRFIFTQHPVHKQRHTKISPQVCCSWR